MPFGDLVRLTLLGSAERMSAQRALQIGLVTEVVPGAELADRAGWAAGDHRPGAPRRRAGNAAGAVGGA